jgi:hypothetical protein
LNPHIVSVSPCWAVRLGISENQQHSDCDVFRFFLLFAFFFFILTECPAEEGKYPVPLNCVGDYYECVDGYPQKLIF